MYLGVLGFRGIKVSTGPEVTGELNTRHEVSDETVLLIDEVHVEEVRERLAVQHGHHVGVNTQKQREGRRDIGTEHRTLVLLGSFLKERLRSLEPEVVQPVGDGAQQRPAVRPRDRTDGK